MAPDLDGKRLELLKEAFPKVVRAAFLWDRLAREATWPLTEMEAAAKELGVKLQSLDVGGLNDFASAFARAKKGRRPGAHYDHNWTYQYSATPSVGVRGKEPVAGDVPNSEFVDAGGLMSYAPNYTDL